MRRVIERCFDHGRGKYGPIFLLKGGLEVWRFGAFLFTCNDFCLWYSPKFDWSPSCLFDWRSCPGRLGCSWQGLGGIYHLGLRPYSCHHIHRIAMSYLSKIIRCFDETFLKSNPRFLLVVWFNVWKCRVTFQPWWSLVAVCVYNEMVLMMARCVYYSYRS